MVVDPGVGSERKPIIIQSEHYFFVGPDNGVLSLAADQDKVQKVVEITNRRYYLEPVSDTFHGRDIFAPVAAHLVENRAIESFGTLIQDWIQITIPKAQVSGNKIHGEIIHIDKFGNVITNISQQIFQTVLQSNENKLKLMINKRTLTIPLCKSYNEGEIGDLLGIFGSTGFLEISRNQASAANSLEIEINDKISIGSVSD